MLILVLCTVKRQNTATAVLWSDPECYTEIHYYIRGGDMTHLFLAVVSSCNDPFGNEALG